MQGGFVMRVEDDGQGFNHDQLAASNADRKGVGISTMRERALLLRGTLDIASSEDAGTCVTLQVPGVMRGELYHE
jgi:signal transduction histidine kinase